MDPAPRCQTLASCPVCGAPGARERFASPDLLMSVPGLFRYVECEACGTVYQNPRVLEEDLALCYPAGYYTHEGDEGWSPSPAPAGSFRDRLRRAIRRAADGVPDRGLPPAMLAAGALLARLPALRRRARFDLVDALGPPPPAAGRCLEVGPGRGLDLLRMRLLGWTAFGLDVDPLAAERARATSGCEVRVGTLATTDYPAASFDLVYMSHVFEHLPDPGRALARCRDLLKAGGRLVVVYPNPGALTGVRYGPLSVVWDPPRHLVLAAPAPVAALSVRCGFVEPCATTTARQAAANFEAARRRRRGQRWDPLRPGEPRLADRALAVAEALLAGLGRPVGEEVVLTARKPAGP